MRADGQVEEIVRELVGDLQLADPSPVAIRDILNYALARLVRLLPESQRPVANHELARAIDETREGVTRLHQAFNGHAEQAQRQAGSTQRNVLDSLDSVNRSNLNQIQGLKSKLDALANNVAAAAAAEAGRVAERIVGDEPMAAVEDRLSRSLRQALDSRLDSGRLLRIDDVIELFDNLERWRNLWKVGEELNESEQPAQEQVVAALGKIQAGMDRWADNHELTAVPRPADGPRPPYDVTRHRRLGVQATDNPALHDTVARVERAGYDWRGENLRKAHVVVYKCEAPAPASSTPEPGADA
jgi:molecular chaperone GrpE (heat shock protein)